MINDPFEKINIVYEDNSRAFMGLKVLEDKINIHVPSILRFSENQKEKKKEIIAFLKSLNLANSRSKYITDGQQATDDFWPIDSYLWIIKDYLENGYYYNRFKVNSINKGKINWKKTLKQTSYVSELDVFYPKMYTSKFSPCNDEISMIYRVCLSVSLNRIGWLYGFEFSENIQQTLSITEMVYYVRNELSCTFDDLKRTRYKHMLDILLNVKQNDLNSSKCSFGILNYYTVFEIMADKLLDGIDPDKKREFHPTGSWKLRSKPTVKMQPLRPDTVYLKGHNTYIYDAKMYKYGVTGKTENLPGTDSMQKQITYADYVKNHLMPDSNVRNAFLIPFDKKSKVFENDTSLKLIDQQNGLNYIGYAKVDWRDSESLSDYDFIYTFLIDFKYVLMNYNKVEHKTITQICNTIENLVEKNNIQK